MSASLVLVLVVLLLILLVLVLVLVPVLVQLYKCTVVQRIRQIQVFNHCYYTSTVLVLLVLQHC
jgi:hypothetical protein